MANKGRKPKGTRKHKGTEMDSVPSIHLKDYLPSFLARHENIIGFVGPYLLYIALFTAIYIIFQDRFTFLSAMTANALSVLMSLFGVDSFASGQSVYMNGFSVMVIDECTGMYELLVYAGCVLAYPTTMRKRSLGIVLGIPAMLTINMFRLVFLSFVGLMYPSLFSYVHYYLWQVTFIFLIILLLLLWIENVVKNGAIE
ncbi:archaeosortase B [Methanolobus sp. WCC4]|uniref:archaeosortase B n=1 Tax=Methanolobus sp. WCC4 TaxID=3125784 RepID=UPI0030F9D421